jgi:hypothetical protein
MCKWGNTKKLNIAGKDRDIDSCIYDLVKILNENYKPTIACCCGHGKQPSSIVFNDKSEIRIMTYKQARMIDKLFSAIN